MHPPIRLVAIDMDGTLLPHYAQKINQRTALALKAAQDAGVTVAIATGRRTAYAAPLLLGLGLRADTPLITSNGAVLRSLGGDAIDQCHLKANVARGLCGLLRGFGAVVFTFDRMGRGDLVLENLEQAQGRGLLAGRLAGLAPAEQERVVLGVVCEQAAIALGHDSAEIGRAHV